MLALHRSDQQGVVFCRNEEDRVLTTTKSLGRLRERLEAQRLLVSHRRTRVGLPVTRL
jgi:hypothetical protein